MRPPPSTKSLPSCIEGRWFLLASSAILFVYLKNPPVLTVTSAFTRPLTAARNAPSKSGLELRTSNESRGIFSVRAAVSYSWKPVRSGALGVAQRTPNAGYPRDRLLKQFQSFSAQGTRQQSKSRDISVWTHEAID